MHLDFANIVAHLRKIHDELLIGSVDWSHLREIMRECCPVGQFVVEMMAEYTSTAPHEHDLSPRMIANNGSTGDVADDTNMTESQLLRQPDDPNEVEMTGSIYYPKEIKQICVR